MEHTKIKRHIKKIPNKKLPKFIFIVLVHYKFKNKRKIGRSHFKVYLFFYNLTHMSIDFHNNHGIDYFYN
ncbi:hypothetical protein UT300002_15880 [Clostridium perfringens]